MQNMVEIKTLQGCDVENVLKVLDEPYMLSRKEQYKEYFNRCVSENIKGDRVTFLAVINHDDVVGYVNIIFSSLYPYFRERRIPEINDLYVVPKHRKNGIGKMLIDECERYASCSYAFIGLGVGLYKDYGSAQRLYTKNGYELDGNGLMYSNEQVAPGQKVLVDDDLLLYLYKRLKR